MIQRFGDVDEMRGLGRQYLFRQLLRQGTVKLASVLQS
jgi:hypothetical protein